MNSNILKFDSLIDQAAHWVMRLNEDDFSDAEREEFHRWWLADPRHHEEFTAQITIFAMMRELSLDDLEKARAEIAPAARRPGARQRALAGDGGSAAATVDLGSHAGHQRRGQPGRHDARGVVAVDDVAPVHRSKRARRGAGGAGVSPAKLGQLAK